MSNDATITWLPTNGTNAAHFSVLPAGDYNSSDNSFENLRVKAYIWTVETEGTTIAHACEFGAMCGTSEYIPGSKTDGYSVRCVMDY